jgi:HTH-type transcriptional regulator/antitoxin HigA
MNEIFSRDEYEQALALMDTLVDDYDANQQLIEQLSLAIELWEEQAPEFAEFNRAVAGEPEP